MEEALQELLSPNGVSAVEIDYLHNTKQISTVKKLVNLFDHRSDVTTYVRGLAAPHNASDDLLVGLKQAWREADNLSTLLLENKNIGSSDDDYAPLPAATHRLLNTTFLRAFGFQFQPSEIGPDSLIGRQRREMERKQPTVYDLTKVRRLVEVQFRPQAKRQKLANDVHLTTGAKPEDLPGLVSSGDLFNTLESHQVLLNTMSHAGTLEFVKPDGSRMLYCDYVEVRKYAARGRLAVARALASGVNQQLILQLFSATDQKFREKWVELIRAAPNSVCYSTAIETTLVSLEPVWAWEYPNLQLAPMQAPGNGLPPSMSEGESRVSPQQPLQQSQSQPQGSLRPVMTAKFNNEGAQKICKAWCDNRNGKGCQNPCPKKEKHNYCDVLISQNKACGQDHIRAQHTGPIYGYVQ